MTPQQLGALIKKTGVTKSQSKQGNSYAYCTEGYSLTRQYPRNRYTVEYYGRTSLSIPSESQREAFNQRKSEALAKIKIAIQDKGIQVEEQDSTLWITLSTNEMVVA